MEYNNLTLLTDFYQLTMMQGYFLNQDINKNATFDLFYRKTPSNNGYAIAAGLEQVIHYVENLEFSESDLEYLKSQNVFTKEFINYLKNFKFSGDIYAVKEGSLIFPHEPIIRVSAPIMEAQFIETALLNIINHQSLIATKAARVVWSANGDNVLEFGLRRAQGPDAAIFGARAAIIGGCGATSNVIAGKMFGVPVRGTHAHSWVMSFDSEIEAFRSYSKIYPDGCLLLVDTYNTLKSGVPNAIQIFQEMKDSGILLKNYGIRLDSGDLAYLSKKARKMLDDAGFEDAIISASSDLDENIITSLKLQGAKINLWGVGTKLITSDDWPAFGGVYKLSAEIENNKLIPKIKLSDTVEKVTNPSIKKIFRIYDKETNKLIADLITLDHEIINENEDLTIFHPISTWKKMTLKANTFYTKDILIPVFINGKCVYESPSVLEIRDFAKKELETLWDENKRLTNPHILPVDLSKELYDLKEKLIKELTL